MSRRGKQQRGVPLRSADEIALSREAGGLAARVLAMLAPHVQPGVSTGHLDRLCHDYIVDVLGCVPTNVGYGGFPGALCTSVNHVVCHGIPSAATVLKEGDIINLDVAVTTPRGWIGDTSRMYYVGEPGNQARRLVETTYEALLAGIRAVKPGATLGDVGHAIQSIAERERFGVVRDYCGHGIGTVYHDEPQVLHYGQPGAGLLLEPGMIFTIEPMLTAGKATTRELADGWTVITHDKSLSAQWEHMVAVTDSGFDVLTRWPDGTGDYPAI
ncbi:type I methionyl aminopeptidase [Diaphorobacter aerolatus]|uniref:Methionine aminopeptidase n=1 Tax=Diaphorobacter aerolatus TaxID=1288495 RepID=A0A7H0GFQ2_9BURK|nr:type I methionyl aminopeptidase [Diaphorobacter aerolatus]QNP47118.1 type I methionyl aminopeptidase [Diaphorobacter aerolatus]